MNDDRPGYLRGERMELSAERELKLFAEAEALLARRRASLCGAGAVPMVTRLADRRPRGRDFGAAVAGAAVAASLLMALLLSRGGATGRPAPTFADLPELPRNNDFSNRYDAQRTAEQQAYESEVKDAHDQNSGGV